MDLPPGVPLDQLPGLEPPPGVTPNFVNPDNYQSTIIATLAVCLTLATIFTALRVYSKVFVTKSIVMEDYTSILAWAFYVPYVGVAAACLRYGTGIHQWDVPLSSVIEFGKLSTVVELLYSLAILTAKITILLQINRVFVTSRKSIRFYLVQLLIWSNVLWYILAFFMVAFQCSPRAKIWNPLLPGNCFISFYSLTFINAALNVVSDVVMLVMPILWIWKLQMAWKRKVGVSLIFASGIFACLSSVLRLVAVARWGREPDRTWYLSIDALWTTGETTSAIICGCLPTLPRAFVHLGSKISDVLSTYRSSRARDWGGSLLQKIKALGVRKPAASIPHSDDYFELTNQNGRPSNHILT